MSKKQINKLIFYISTIGAYLVIFMMNFIGLYLIKMARFPYVLGTHIFIIASMLTLFVLNRDLSWLNEKYEEHINKEERSTE